MATAVSRIDALLGMLQDTQESKVLTKSVGLEDILTELTPIDLAPLINRDPVGEQQVAAQITDFLHRFGVVVVRDPVCAAFVWDKPLPKHCRLFPSASSLWEKCELYWYDWRLFFTRNLSKGVLWMAFANRYRCCLVDERCSCGLAFPSWCNATFHGKTSQSLC